MKCRRNTIALVSALLRDPLVDAAQGFPSRLEISARIGGKQRLS